MPAYTSKLKGRDTVAERTLAFHFEKPPGFQFKAGQYVDITLIDPPETDSEGNVRTFSIASAPVEDEILLATRMRESAFKKVLGKVPLGTAVKLEGPMGSFTLHNNAKKAGVFLAGGIGITPFLGILRQAAREKSPHKLYLFYSNRRPEDAAFLEELRKLEAQHPNFRFIPSMSEMDRSKLPWKGETGFIDKEMLKRYLPSLQGPIYYVAGPPEMVAAMRRILTEGGVEEDDIRTEEFSGY